jgi:hypothetical protein
VDRIHLTQDKIQWQAFADAEMKFVFHKRQEVLDQLGDCQVHQNHFVSRSYLKEGKINIGGHSTVPIFYSWSGMYTILQNPKL